MAGLVAGDVVQIVRVALVRAAPDVETGGRENGSRAVVRRGRRRWRTGFRSRSDHGGVVVVIVFPALLLFLLVVSITQSQLDADGAAVVNVVLLQAGYLLVHRCSSWC